MKLVKTVITSICNAMTKKELKQMIRESIEEIVSGQMVGIHELMTFYKEADQKTIDQVDSLLKSGATEKAWDIVTNYLESVGKLFR